jgi:hypothetical protein
MVWDEEDIYSVGPPFIDQSAEGSMFQNSPEIVVHVRWMLSPTSGRDPFIVTRHGYIITSSFEMQLIQFWLFKDLQSGNDTYSQIERRCRNHGVKYVLFFGISELY